LLENNNSTASLSTGSSQSQISYADALENHKKNTDWWVVYAAFDLPDFQSSPLWLSSKLNLTVDTVIEALEGLTVLGHLKKDANGYAPSKGRNFVQLNVTQGKKADVIEDHSLISRQIINHLSEEALMAVDHRCFASNVEILKELYSDINAAFEKAYKNSSKVENNDRIFKMSFTAVDVLPGRQ
jgi:hypothetical protein